MVLHVSTPSVCELESARQRRLQLSFGFRLNFSSLASGSCTWVSEPLAGLALRLLTLPGAPVTVQSHCLQGSAAILHNAPCQQCLTLRSVTLSLTCVNSLLVITIGWFTKDLDSKIITIPD
jgi:hypothetical protein